MELEVNPKNEELGFKRELGVNLDRRFEWQGLSIWKGFGMGFQGFGKDSRFGKDLGRDCVYFFISFFLLRYI